jgi:hypothetical protein
LRSLSVFQYLLWLFFMVSAFRFYNSFFQFFFWIPAVAGMTRGVNPRASASHSCECRNPRLSVFPCFFWIPAVAGMTLGGAYAGMTSTPLPPSHPRESGDPFLRF